MFVAEGNGTIVKEFSDGSLFSPILFGKYFDPSDAFPLWEFESEVLLANLRCHGRTAVDWYQTDDAYLLKAELPGAAGKVTPGIYVDSGKTLEISGQWKADHQRERTKDWRSGRWWQHGYVRRLELPGDAEWKKIKASIIDGTCLELWIPKIKLEGGASIV